MVDPVIALLVRHGKSAAPWHLDQNASLSDAGHAQAAAAAPGWMARLPGARICSSPLRRALQTAQPLADLTGAAIRIEPVFTEIPHPGHLPPDQLRKWLDWALAADWREHDGVVTDWRGRMLDFLASLDAPAIIFSHHFNLNAVWCALHGRGNGGDYAPAHCGVLAVGIAAGRLRPLV